MAARWSRIFVGRRSCAAATAATGYGLSAVFGNSAAPPGLSCESAPLPTPTPSPNFAGFGGRGAVQCEALAPQVRCGTLRLRDGRTLAYHEEGAGVPVVAMHGMGSSRLTWLGKRPLSEFCPGVRLIAVDRPGYGGSSNPPFGYSYTTFAEDVAELADALQLPRFCAMGHSSGGPYALALAGVLPDRVAAVAAVSSDAPYYHPQTPQGLRDADMFAQPAELDPMGLYGKDPRAAAEEMRAHDLSKGLPAKAHAWRRGVDGWLCDYLLERVPWSFSLEKIALGPRLSIWYGSEDFEAIKIGGVFMNQLLQGSQLRVVQGGNHGFKSDPKHLATILNELKSSMS